MQKFSLICILLIFDLIYNSYQQCQPNTGENGSSIDSINMNVDSQEYFYARNEIYVFNYPLLNEQADVYDNKLCNADIDD